MKSIQKTLSGFMKKDYIGLVGGILLFASYHQGMWFSGDDLDLRAQNFNTLTDYLEAIQNSYFTWSSRFFMDSVARFFSNASFYLFIVAQILLFGCMLYCLYRMLFAENRRAGGIIIACTMLLFPVYIMGETGWIFTSVVYLWVICCGVISFYPLYKALKGLRIAPWEYIIYLLATLYVCNQEQSAALMLCVYIAVLGALIVRKRKMIFAILQIGISIGSIIYALTAPGNQLRASIAISSWFPEYSMLNFFDKLEIGFTSTMYEIVLRFNSIFLIVSALCCILVWKRFKTPFYRFLGAVPIVCTLVFSNLQSLVNTMFPSLSLSPTTVSYLDLYYSPVRNGMITIENADSVRAYLPIIIYGMMCVCMMLCIYLLLGNTFRAILCESLFAGGIATRMVLAFSPTIYASGERTFSYLWFCMLLILLLLLEDAWKRRTLKEYNCTMAMGILAVFGYLDGWMSRYF